MKYQISKSIIKQNINLKGGIITAKGIDYYAAKDESHGLEEKIDIFESESADEAFGKFNSLKNDVEYVSETMKGYYDVIITKYYLYEVNEHIGEITFEAVAQYSKNIYTTSDISNID